MSEENKPKIDLKARLGKRAVPTQAGVASIPPPMGLQRPNITGVAQPVPGQPAPGQPVPMPAVRPSTPFSQPAPRPDPTNPYASVPAQSAPRPEPTAIRVELGEEVIAEQKRAASKTRVGMAVVAAITLIIGFFVGGRYNNNQITQGALGDAKLLAEKVQKANATVAELADTLDEARKQLKDLKYPEAQIQKLGELNVAIRADDIPVGVGRFKSDIRQALFSYVKQAEEANEKKESLQNLLSGQAAAFKEIISDRENPKIRWAAVVAEGSSGPWLELAPVAEPFLVQEQGKSWPSQLLVRRPTVQDGRAQLVEAKVDRIERSDLKISSALPISPASQSAACVNDTFARIQSELYKMHVSLRGDETPGAEKEGLVKLGERLQKSLNDIGTGGGA